VAPFAGTDWAKQILADNSARTAPSANAPTFIRVLIICPRPAQLAAVAAARAAQLSANSPTTLHRPHRPIQETQKKNHLAAPPPASEAVPVDQPQADRPPAVPLPPR
jgi:hypothetical protein